VPDGSRTTRRPSTIHFARSFAGWVRRWPWSRRSLIVLLRVAATLGTTLLLVLTWHVMAALPWPIEGLITLAACLAFSYRFERRDRM
jgi:hypothetical protein